MKLDPGMKFLVGLLAALTACSTTYTEPEKFDNPCKPDPQAKECTEISTP